MSIDLLFDVALAGFVAAAAHAVAVAAAMVIYGYTP
jgi:hypothetical protein